MISDASTVKYLQRNIILSESEGQVSPVKDVTKHKATLSEKREDCVDYSYMMMELEFYQYRRHLVKLDKVLDQARSRSRSSSE